MMFQIVNPLIKRMSGLNTNKNGMMKPANDNRIASTPVSIGPAPAIGAAAKAASATGGVTMERTPK